ncbi:Hpt domain-containing protein, partial [Neoroseomonas rubea]|uniref:Hpt domain-containing protein n=1 Tax=Neoroseomonas rubea TaxID=2748666 RepID=UPI0018DEF1AC
PIGAAAPAGEPHAAPALLDRTTLEELRSAVGPGRLPRLIGVFADETRARLSRLTSTDDLRAIEEEAHGLKSAAGTFGAAALREAAAALEAACMAGDLRRALALKDALPALVERSLAAYPARMSRE